MSASRAAQPLLVADDLRVHYEVPQGLLRAVEGVSFSVLRGETLGLVGESGCGKSTVLRAFVGLAPIAGGDVRLGDRSLRACSVRERRALSPRIQMVFQDPYASLDPRMSIGAQVAEGLRVHRRGTSADIAGRVSHVLAAVGLDPSLGRRYPHEFSGGQRQRIGLARALVLEPDVLLLDEPVSALDVSVQAQVLNLLQALRNRLGLTYVFVAHHLGVVRHVSDRVAVMYLGRIVEIGDRKAVFETPRHPYTRALLSAVPEPDPLVERNRQRIPLIGDAPSPLDVGRGCPFRARCPDAFAPCATEVPALREIQRGHQVACHLADPDPGP